MKQSMRFATSCCFEWGQLIFLGISLLFSASLLSQTRSPELVVESAIYNFGTVPEGKDVNHDFIIRNNGTEVLNIENVSST